MNDELNMPDHPDLRDIRLTRAEIKLLKIINKRKSISGTEAKELARKFEQDNAAIRLWMSNRLVEWRRDDDVVEIIGRGSLWLEYHRQDFIRDHLANIISLALSGLALAVSIVSLIKSA